MQVNLSFDTEKDTAEDFQKLLDYIKQILAEKEGKQYVPEQREQPRPPQQPQQQRQQQTQARTAGGCKIVPYEDLSNQLFSLCSKQRK